VAAAPPVAEEPGGWAAEEPVDRRAARPVARPVEGSEAPPWVGRVASAEEPAPVPQVKAGRPGQPMVASTRADLAPRRPTPVPLLGWRPTSKHPPGAMRLPGQGMAPDVGFNQSTA
jgi:hypothetical protein